MQFKESTCLFCLARLGQKSTGLKESLSSSSMMKSLLSPPLLRFGPVPISPTPPHVVRDNCEIGRPRRMELFCVSSVLRPSSQNQRLVFPPSNQRIPSCTASPPSPFLPSISISHP